MKNYTISYIDNNSGQVVYQTIVQAPDFQAARASARSLKKDIMALVDVDLLHTTPFVKLNRIK